MSINTRQKPVFDNMTLPLGVNFTPGVNFVFCVGEMFTLLFTDQRLTFSTYWLEKRKG
jgi:hypothetical protein